MHYASSPKKMSIFRFQILILTQIDFKPSKSSPFNCLKAHMNKQLFENITKTIFSRKMESTTDSIQCLSLGPNNCTKCKVTPSAPLNGLQSSFHLAEIDKVSKQHNVTSVIEELVRPICHWSRQPVSIHGHDEALHYSIHHYPNEYTSTVFWYAQWKFFKIELFF